MPKSKRTRTRVETTVHEDAQRRNIPTTELGSFLTDQEKEPISVPYPRDPSLDPQLVWKGKDEQDQHPLEVAAVPIYIQEKIHPKALIEALRAEKAGAEAQLNLWADFNGIELEELVKFYQHDQHWSNRLILGDSLLVMNSLAEKEGLKGQVQMIYIDPPYGIKFGSNWQVSTRKRDVRDGKVEDTTRQPEQVKAFRDTWELGIHSYLSYLRDRLVVARDLLSDSGSVFVQIGEENVHLVRCLMDEVFGSEQRVASIVVEKTSGLGMEYLDQVTDYILWYARRYESLRFRPLYLDKRTARMGEAYFRFVELADGTRRPLTPAEAEGEVSLPPGARRFTIGDLTSQTQAATTRYVAEFRGRKYESGKRQWATPPSGMQKLIWANRVEPRAESIGMVRYFDDFPVVPLRNVWTDTGTGSFTDPKVYVVQTGVKVVERCILLATDPGDLVLAKSILLPPLTEANMRYVSST